MTKHYTAFGETKTLKQWFEDDRCVPQTLHALRNRLHSMPFYDALTTAKLPSGPSKSPRDTEREKAICRAYVEGKTLEQVGNNYGITRERVRQILSRCQIPRRHNIKFPVVRKNTDEFYAEAVKLYLAGEKMRDVCNKLGIVHNRFGSYLHLRGLSRGQEKRRTFEQGGYVFLWCSDCEKFKREECFYQYKDKKRWHTYCNECLNRRSKEYQRKKRTEFSRTDVTRTGGG